MQTPSSSPGDLQTSPLAPGAPAAPAAPAAPVVVGATAGEATIFIPRTAQEIDALRARREELSTQLNSATSRRAELARKLPGMDNAVRAGVEQRIALLDRRILNLESQIDQNGQQLAAASPAVLAAASTTAPFFSNANPEVITPIAVTFTMFVLAPISIAASRFLWKRAIAPPRPPALNAEAAQRLDRIENAVDAIAIEVERVSEGQRFLTRLFTQGGKESPAALGVGERPAEPIPVGARDAVGVRGSDR
jgi:hypothetical protein